MPKLEAVDIDAVRELVAAGQTNHEIAEAFSVSEASVRRFLKRHGIVRAKRVAALVPAPPGDEVSREEILEKELAEARSALRRARGEDVREARVLDALANGIKAAEPVYVPSPRHVGSTYTAHELVLLWSDSHAGETVSRIETNGLNEYDWEIMWERHRQLAQALRSHRDHYGEKARRLRIAALGDMLSGVIHQELAETNDVPFAESVVRFGIEAADWVAAEFGDEFEEIIVDGVVGNHPRFSQKPRAKVAYDNGDWIAYNVMRERLRQYKHITVNAPRAAQTVIDVLGRKILLAHGDGVRTTMQGVPWGGIIRHGTNLTNLFALANVKVDHIFGGHWHNPQIAEDFRILINGSIKGVDEYSIKKYGGGTPPVQLLTAFHAKHGITGVHKIDCEAKEG